MRGMPCAAALLLLLACPARALERKAIVFALPPGEDVAWVSGNFSFSPGELASAGQVRLVREKGGEVAAVVTPRNTWFDDSVMLVEIGFTGRRGEERSVWVEWGEEVRDPPRLARKPKHPVEVGFEIFEAGGAFRIRGPVDVGTLVVRVEKHAGARYYWNLLPLALIVGWVGWRKYRLRKR